MIPAAHAFLAPSSAPIWGPGGCPASPTHQGKYPEDAESEESREGVAAHHYVTETILGRTVAAGDIAPNGFPIDLTMVEAGWDIITDVRDTYDANGGILAVEERVHMAATVHPHNWGTPDVTLIVFARKVLFVWDYKYGHRYVDAFRNWQCVDYAAGVLESNGVPVEDWPNWTIYVTIAQPRNYHPDGPLRQWKFAGAELVTLVGELRAAAIEAMEPDAPFRTGDHCRDCTGRHACPALQQATMNLVDVSLRGQPIDLPPLAVGLELTFIRAAIKRLSARSQGLEEQALALNRNGVDVPFWKSEYSQGREKWTVPIGEVFALGDLYGVDVRKPPDAITPAQARKAGVDADMVKAVSDKPRGALSLVPVTNHDIAKRFS